MLLCITLPSSIKHYFHMVVRTVRTASVIGVIMAGLVCKHHSDCFCDARAAGSASEAGPLVASEADADEEVEEEEEDVSERQAGVAAASSRAVAGASTQAAASTVAADQEAATAAKPEAAAAAAAGKRRNDEARVSEAMQRYLERKRQRTGAS